MTADGSNALPGYELVITRVFDAPRELVWKAWTDPAMAKQWMGPKGFRVTEFTNSTEAGGPWRLKMSGERFYDGQHVDLSQGGRTLEADPPRRLVYTFAWDDRSAVGLGESPVKENVVTITFEEQDGKTHMEFRQKPFATEGERDGHNGGWNSGFDKLAEFLAAQNPQPTGKSVNELHMKRFFAAPRQTLFEAWTKPEIIAKWWGPKGFTNPVCEVDARNGGAIRIDMRAPDGKVFPMSGKFLEIYPPDRITFTSSALDDAGRPIFTNRNTVYFREVTGGTELALDVNVVEQSEGAQQYLESMEQGWSMSLDKLEELLVKETA